MPAKLLGAAAELAQRKFGGPLEESDSVESIGVTASRIFGNDPERVFVLLVNLSNNTIYVAFDSGVAAARGIVLASNGGNYQVNAEEDGTLPIREMFAVSTGASSNLYVVTQKRFATTAQLER